jgi:excisionase family DNA binding protein
VADKTVLVGEFLGQRIAMTVEDFHAASAAARSVLGEPMQPAAQVKGAVPRPAQAPESSGPERLYSPEEAAEMTGTSRSWWIKQARLGKVPSVKVGRRVRFRLAHISDALGNPDYLDPGIRNAGIARKPLEKKGRASTRNKKVTAIVRVESPADAGEAAGLP